MTTQEWERSDAWSNKIADYCSSGEQLFSSIYFRLRPLSLVREGEGEGEGKRKRVRGVMMLGSNKIADCGSSGEQLFSSIYFRFRPLSPCGRGLG